MTPMSEMAWRVSWHLEYDHCRKKATFSGREESKAIRVEVLFVGRLVLSSVSSVFQGSSG
jgi:hypothetical protein